MNNIIKFIIVILFFFIVTSFFDYKKKDFIIKVDISGSQIGNRGPSKFVEGIKNILPYNTKKCSFSSLHKIINFNKKNVHYYFFPFPQITESFYDNLAKKNKTKKIILGPIFVPIFWNNFPDNNIWCERRFSEILNNVKGIVVHSNRIRDYLVQKINTSKNYINKFKIVRPCTNLKPKYINSFNERTNDIIFFEKYADINRTKQAHQLLDLFKNTTFKIERLVYGNYTEKQMKDLAKISKYIIYFSFYDTGAIGLKEIQNYGVYAFTHQKDLAINNDTSFFIQELSYESDMNLAYLRIVQIINNITISEPNLELIAKINQEINRCENALDDLCNSIL